MNDPVMGGKSTGTFNIKNNVGVFDGVVADVPSLKAPGFIKFEASKSEFPDISNCKSIQLVARSLTDYKGYSVTFGTQWAYLECGDFYASGYKAPFEIPKSETYSTIEMPFENFSSCWSGSTGLRKKLC